VRPLIGINLDQEASGSFSPAPYAALRVRYFDTVYAAGGLPVGISGDASSCVEYAKRLDGILIPGGECAFPDDWYIDENESAPYPPSQRLDMDVELVKHAIAHNIPLLGICHGMQVMACMSGCKMTRNLHAHYDTNIDHKNGAPKEKICHDVEVIFGTKLRTVTNADIIQTNSYHQESVMEVKENVLISATAPDGVIEAIELASQKFAIGVQWHPEYLVTDADYAIFDAFIKACKDG